MMAKATDFVNLDVGSLSRICTGRPKSCFTLKVSPVKIMLPPHRQPPPADAEAPGALTPRTRRSAGPRLRAVTQRNPARGRQSCAEDTGTA